MEPLKIKKEELEDAILTNFVGNLLLRGWYCVKTHGNKYQKGFPDLYVFHQSYGTRWVEVKRPDSGRLTDAQLSVFTDFSKQKIGVWVVTHHQQHESLMGPSNWVTYLLNTRAGRNLEPVKRIPKAGPEGIIQDKIINKLTSEGWYCLETYGSTFQTGLPDVYCCHKDYGARWIEVKNPAGYKFQPSQRRLFPIMGAYNVPIYILMSETETDRIKSSPPNWRKFLYEDEDVRYTPLQT